MSDADDPNVVKFEPPVVCGQERRMPERKPRNYSRPICHHYATVVDEDLHIVECATCGVALDPVNVLLDISHHWGEYSAAQMGKELQSYRNAAWFIKQNEMRERRIPEERGLTHEEITKRHNESGCPPDRLVITARYLDCYCGVSVSRVHHRELESAALAAQNPVRKRLGLAPTEPANDETQTTHRRRRRRG